MPADWQSLRGEFASLARCTYLNTATYGQTPARARDAMARHLARRDQNACADFLDWFTEMDQLRDRLGQLTGCRGEDIAFFPNAGAALSLLVNGLDWRPGDRMVTLEGEFPNNLYAPALAKRFGAESVETTLDQLPAAITPQTRLVALSSVNYSTGLRPELAALSNFLAARNVLLYIDGTQSVGALRIDLDAIQPAMMAVDCYKWMLTPNGATFAFVHPRVRQWLNPQVIGWRSHHGWRDVDQLHQGMPEFTNKAERYEGGMLAFPVLYALDEVVRLELALGAEVIERRVLDLAARLRDVLRGLGARLLADDGGPYHSQIVAAWFEGRDSAALAGALRQRGVHVSSRYGRLRVSVHFYNNEQDLDRLGVELRALI